MLYRGSCHKHSKGLSTLRPGKKFVLKGMSLGKDATEDLRAGKEMDKILSDPAPFLPDMVSVEDMVTWGKGQGQGQGQLDTVQEGVPSINIEEMEAVTLHNKVGQSVDWFRFVVNLCHLVQFGTTWTE